MPISYGNSARHKESNTAGLLWLAVTVSTVSYHSLVFYDDADASPEFEVDELIL